MCIRDSLNGIVLANYLGFEFIDASEVIFIDEHGNYDQEMTDPVLSKRLSNVKNAVIPVSYTHLDVYKRQPQNAVVLLLL